MSTTTAPAPAHDELASLDALPREGTWRFDGAELRLTNLDKVLFPAREGSARVTKRDLIRYHACVASFMLPYLRDRAVNPHRYPNGADKPGFWHKARPDHAPEFVRAWRYPDADPDETHVYSVIDTAALISIHGNPRHTSSFLKTKAICGMPLCAAWGLASAAAKRKG